MDIPIEGTFESHSRVFELKDGYMYIISSIIDPNKYSYNIFEDVASPQPTAGELILGGNESISVHFNNLTELREFAVGKTCNELIDLLTHPEKIQKEA